jgi:heat-inducible transcriptional repressor
MVEKELTERERNVLLKIAELYIKTGEPVGSRTLQKRYSLPFSPATIRNVMADLEDKGFLFQPHTSAGRIPTDEGLKIYVNNLFLALGEEDETLVNRLINYVRSENVSDRDEILSKVLDFLQNNTGYVGFGVNLAEDLTVNNVVLMRVGKRKILIVVNFHEDYVLHKVVSGDIPDSELPKISKMLTQKLKGKTLRKIKRELKDEIENLKKEVSDVFFKINSLILKSLNEIERLKIHGTSNIINSVSGDLEKLKNLIELLEEKTLFLGVLKKFLSQEKKVDVILGSEVEPELPQVSFVLSKYGTNLKEAGIVGILGPKRMDYSQVIPLVENVARAISFLLE